MKSLAIAVLSLIFLAFMLAIAIQAFAEEPTPQRPLLPGLTIERWADELVIITSAVASCKTVKTTQQYSIRNKEKIRTVHVRCLN